ncbi:aryl hydrocarbon receptor nuclear translocator-like protein 2 isoform X2 [Xenopus laevis]|uniref:Aryl hydrocarbon receptor nuclear translocator-like protein 2 isoform X2 n=1 Tax=Xenopus laevis TaxID=8355 RepID=A0A8J1MJR2_XENLA|nr:aryl hydrocarbon receptor nuclear translocator-like protein 2 isoform X2 [Xenopus laevis]
MADVAAGDSEEMPETLMMESKECMAVSSILGPIPASSLVTSSSFSPSAFKFPRKRKDSDSDDQVTEGSEMSDVQGREAHRETEKRRREKMNNLIENLSAMIPQCTPLPSKPDKLTVLRMAVQHLKSLKGSSPSFADESLKPSFLKHEEMKRLILKVADGFLLVVGCDGGEILFVSESVTKTLKYNQGDLMGKSLFDLLHPKDVAKVKEQLSSSDVAPREKLIDAKSLQVHAHFQESRLHWGSRRSFFCRMKSGRSVHKEQKSFLHSSKKKDHQRYCTIYCTGYLRSCPPSQEDCDSDRETTNSRCLVAIGRLHPYITQQDNSEVKVKPTVFVTRYTMDGKFVYVDQRATAILGYLPQELLGTSCYEYFHIDDYGHLTERHKAVLQSNEKVVTNCYKFRVKDGSFVTLQSQWFSFINPWTKDLEYIVSVNTVVPNHNSSSEETSSLPSSSRSSQDNAKHPFLNIPGTSSETLLGAANIGTQIVKEVMSLQRSNSSPSNGDVSPSGTPIKSPPALTDPSTTVQKGQLATEMEKLDTARSNSVTSYHRFLSDSNALNFGQDETTMAALMNIFEADGGLGDSQELSDMPWAL